MFNVCVVSGVVLSEPKLKSFEGLPQTMFKLGIMLGSYKAGYITVCCPRNLAPVAADYLQRGDRVAVSGIIGRYEYDPEIKPLELVLVAREMELVRKDSPTMGLTA